MSEILDLMNASSPKLLLGMVVYLAFGMRRDIEKISNSVIQLNEKIALLVADKKNIDAQLLSQQKQIDKLYDIVHDLNKES